MSQRPWILTFLAIPDDSLSEVGGKGLSLGRMNAAQLPVPPGFCITCTAYRASVDQKIAPALRLQILAAYRHLGHGKVAVRSSATAEDGATASFAGQQETILGVEGENPLIEAIERCWRSLHTERAKAYRQKQGVDEAQLAMAVVVQKLVAAEVAGVLFTRDPMDPEGKQMLIEASWGLGEAVVSGKVQPDRFQIARETRTVLTRQPGLKMIRITAHGEEAVPTDQQNQICLSDSELSELAELGLAVEKFYGDTRDIEWALAEGKFWLLQARPITTISAMEREQFRQAEIAKLRKNLPPQGNVWSRCNLVEVLPEPTPMTWSIVDAYLLSGRGGSGQMYRAFAYSPDPALDRQSAYDLIGGRPYLNLEREPRLQAKHPLFGYPFEKYRAQPLLAVNPQIDSSKKLPGAAFWRLPFRYWNLLRSGMRILKGVSRFPDDFRETILPRWETDLAEVQRESLENQGDHVVFMRLNTWIQKTLVDFASHSLRPTLFAHFCMQVIEQQLRKPLGEERTRAVLAELSAGARPDPGCDLAQGIQDLIDFKISKATFLERFGHRGSQEMELSQPRWSEDPAALDHWVKGSRSLPPKEESGTLIQRIIDEAKLPDLVAKSFRKYVESLQIHLGLRETGKHHFMRGYAVIRQCLLELDRRHQLQGGIFYLTLEELQHPLDFECAVKIEQRRRERTIALGMDVPQVLFSEDLEAIGRPTPIQPGTQQFQGIPLSTGMVEGPAWVLTEPMQAADVPEGYILVCPSTDPSWVPLFVHAKGLVMESGGVLSHGAIVAREFGLPAVAGLPNITRQIPNGQQIRVDGSRGIVNLIHRD